MDWKAGFDNAFSDVFRGRNLLLLVASWFGGISLLVAYGTLSGSQGSCEPCVAPALMTLQSNETGPVAARRRSAEAGSDVSYRIAFDNLCAEDTAAGVFRTASGKRVHIDNLQVVFERPAVASPSNPKADVRLRHFHDLFVPRREGDSGAGQLGILDEFRADAADWSARIDLANATDVQIRNMSWTICDGLRTALQVQCRHACLAGNTPYVTLRGHAVVTTPEATLESNYIEMNVRDECFVVRGRYLLTRGGRKEAGVGACFDRALEIVSAPTSDAGEDRGWANELSL